MAYDPELLDEEMYKKLGAENVGRKGAGGGIAMMPAWATTRYPDAGGGHLDFDVKKARAYAKGKADHIAKTFNEAVQRWEMMESWK
jgi:creatinine amidohydrolase